MRYAGRTIVAAVIAGTSTAAVALFSAYRLADAPIRGRLSGPDPLGSIASLVAAVIAIAAFYALGRSVAADAPSAQPAIISGAFGGALAGLIASVAQSVALSDYLRAVLAGYAVPPEFLAIALGTYVVLATVGASALAGAITYAGWYQRRPRTG
jgi:hypothetical protein